MRSFSPRTCRLKRGVTFIEVMLAASILALTVLAVFEGIAVSARIARENAEYLQADAYAFDLAWKRYNESYGALRNLVSASAPQRTFDEDIVEGGNLPVKVFSNENLGMNTLVHGHMGAQQSSRISGKLRGWTNYKNGDNVMVSFKRKHFFDKETTNAIRKEGR